MANVSIVNGADYDTLVDAVVAAEPNDIIVLNNDLEGAGVALFANPANGPQTKPLTIDFNGHTYTCIGPAVGSKGTQSQAFHLEANSDYTCNDIILKNGTITSNSPQVKMLVQNYSNLKLVNMVVDGSGLPSDGASRYVVSNNNGSTSIKGSTIICADDDDFAFDVCGYAAYPGAQVAVEDSKIQGNIEISYSTTKRPSHDMSLTIGAGTEVTGKLSIDSSVTKEIIESNFPIAKDKTVALEVESKDDSLVFGNNGDIVTSEEKAEEDRIIAEQKQAEAENCGGVGYSPFTNAMSIAAAQYVSRTRMMNNYRYMMSK